MHNIKLFAITVIAGSLALTVAAVAANLIIRAPVAGGGVGGAAQADVASLEAKVDALQSDLAALAAALGSPPSGTIAGKIEDLITDVAGLDSPGVGTPTNTGKVQHSSADASGFTPAVMADVFAAMAAGYKVRISCKRDFTPDSVQTGIAYHALEDEEVSFAYGAWDTATANNRLTCFESDQSCYAGRTVACTLGWVLVW